MDVGYKKDTLQYEALRTLAMISAPHPLLDGVRHVWHPPFRAAIRAIQSVSGYHIRVKNNCMS